MTNFIFCNKDLLLREDNSLPQISDLENIRSQNSVVSFFEEKNLNYKVLTLSEITNLPSGIKKIMVREYFHTHSEEENYICARAKALSQWFDSNKFCSTCGAPLQNHSKLTALECSKCKKVFFPRIEPCIIVVIKKDDKILLARHTYRNQDIFACIAGFIESGESAEHAVHREIFEETGLKVKNVQYKGSQSWPFPDQLMLGFTCDYESGEITLQKDEIAEAKWFDPNNCPASPKPGSIAYKLIHNE